MKIFSKKRHKEKNRNTSQNTSQNIAIIPVEKELGVSDGIFEDTWTEKRYIITDADTGEILDDANGLGYKSKETALNQAFHYNKI